MPRGEDGTLNGQQCLIGGLEIYAAAGAIRLQLLAIIAAERARQEAR